MSNSQTMDNNKSTVSDDNNKKIDEYDNNDSNQNPKPEPIDKPSINSTVSGNNYTKITIDDVARQWLWGLHY